MCGNGLRAAALHLWTKGGHNRAKELTILTDAGLLRCRAKGSLRSGLIETEMGEPRFPAATKSASVPMVQGTRPMLVNIGNPHAVFWLTPPRANRASWLARYGSFVENHRAFPRRTKVEFATIRGPHAIDVIVWERGVGLTEACGTGAVAVATAAIRQGLCQTPVNITFPGGTVTVSWRPGTSAFLTGKAAYSYAGEFYWSS